MNKLLLLEKSQLVKEEATKILELTNIVKSLDIFGDVNLIGSYSYNVMLAKDIDFHVVVEKLDANLAKMAIDCFLDKGLFEHIEFRDKHNFNKEAAARYATKKALDSFYFGLKMTVDGSEWQIGINFITKSQAASNEIIVLMKNATDEEREQILEFKHLLLELNLKVSSAYVYRAVIEKGAKTKKELFKYLKTIGYDI